MRYKSYNLPRIKEHGPPRFRNQLTLRMAADTDRRTSQSGANSENRRDSNLEPRSHYVRQASNPLLSLLSFDVRWCFCTEY